MTILTDDDDDDFGDKSCGRRGFSPQFFSPDFETEDSFY